MKYSYDMPLKIDRALTNRTAGIIAALIIPALSVGSAFYFTNHNPSSLILGMSDQLSGARESSGAVDSLALNTAPSIFSDKLAPIYYRATELLAPSVNIDIELIEVGVAEDGSLETPKDWSKGGWYKKGAKAGELGNIIINAHYDDNYGRPAAFWQLKNLNLNDKVTVVDELGNSFNYTVVDIYFVDINDPNRLDVLKSHDTSKPTMTLITCGGVWLPGRSTYNKRLVVKAELI
jgi:LPXTG-site transpeptidase (sortase) family protein